jgi:hypothetical protein
MMVSKAPLRAQGVLCASSPLLIIPNFLHEQYLVTGYAGLGMTELTATTKDRPLGTVLPHLGLGNRPQRGGDLRPRGIGRFRGGMPAWGSASSQWTIHCQG